MHSRLPQYKRIQNYGILVDFQSGLEREHLFFKSLICRVASRLFDVPYIKHIGITVDMARPSPPSQRLEDVLQAFTLLSNIVCVNISGIKPVYAQYFKKTMEGSSRLDR